MPELNEILTQNPECTVREIGDGLVILVPKDSTTHSLEDIGVFIWNQIDGKRDLSAILAAILEEYEVTEDTARTDLLAFAEELIAADLIQTS